MAETVLFLCTGNSARSILAEALLNAHGAPRFRAFSAGSQPVGRVNPFAIEILTRQGHAVEGLSSKSWDRFAETGAPRLDVVITVCGNAAEEKCPVWHGAPVHAHWGHSDPAAVDGSDADKRAAFFSVYQQIETRILRFLGLNWAALDNDQRAQALAEIANDGLPA
ncbi:MAG: arsenate reductase ArsC [Pseudomonadota bacterium]